MAVIDKLLSHPENVFESIKDCGKSVSLEESLALFIDNRWSKAQYINMYQKTKNMFPSYTALSNFKKTCSPCEDFINVSETKASV